MVRRVALAVALATGLGAVPAMAGEKRPFRLSYVVPGGCPDAAAFAEAVQTNSARIRPASSGEPSAAVNVAVMPGRGSFSGVLEIRQQDGTAVKRQVSAASCGELVSALALIVTLTLDPDATRAEDVEPAVTTVSPAETAPQPAPAVSVMAPQMTPAAPVTDVAASDDVPSRRRFTSSVLRFGVRAGIASGVAPGVLADFGASLGLTLPAQGAWAPLGMLSAHLAESGNVTAGQASARFRRFEGRFTGCPLAWNSGPFVFRPCALFGVGQLRAVGSNVVPATSARILWAEVGVVGRGELSVSGPLFVAGEVGVIFPLVRDHFYFEPLRRDVFAVPAAAFSAAIELGVRFL